jgi:lipopolysaccharide biosynthesis glycosyltransferase
MLAPSGESIALQDRDPIVVLAADDNFAMPLAVTIRSALDNLSPDRTLRVFILDAGIREETRSRLVQSWPRGRYRIEWLKVDASSLFDVPVSGHVNLVTYYRVLISRVLPAEISRVIYLDADLVVCADLGRLWDCAFNGQWCLAAQDCAAPYLDSSQALANYELCASMLGSSRPVPNLRELGLQGDAAYFNAGVLLVDLDGWRRENLSARMLDCLARYRQHVTWWDQYALNVVLAGRWGRLDPRWNQGSHVFVYPTWEQSPLDRRTFEQMRDDPYIVHYTTNSKPWSPLCPHPLRGLYFEYLDRTVWAGWRPGRLQVMWAQLKTTERRLRHGRKWLTAHARHWFEPVHNHHVLDHAPGTNSTSTQ